VKGYKLGGGRWFRGGRWVWGWRQRIIHRRRRLGSGNGGYFPTKIGEIFFGKYHVKFGHFVNNFPYIYFRAKVFCPKTLTELLRLREHPQRRSATVEVVKLTNTEGHLKNGCLVCVNLKIIALVCLFHTLSGCVEVIEMCGLLREVSEY